MTDDKKTKKKIISEKLLSSKKVKYFDLVRSSQKIQFA